MHCLIILRTWSLGKTLMLRSLSGNLTLCLCLQALLTSCPYRCLSTAITHTLKGEEKSRIQRKVIYSDSYTFMLSLTTSLSLSLSLSIYLSLSPQLVTLFQQICKLDGSNKASIATVSVCHRFMNDANSIYCAAI